MFQIAKVQTDHTGIKGHTGYIKYNNVLFSTVTCSMQNIMYYMKSVTHKRVEESFKDQTGERNNTTE